MDSVSYNNEMERLTNCFNIIQGFCSESVDYNNADQFKELLKQINNKLASTVHNSEKKVIKTCIPMIKATHFQGKNIWIIKPTGFNRGRGVQVFYSLEEMHKIIKDSSQGINENIVQENTNPKQKPNESAYIPQSNDTNYNYVMPESTAWEAAHPPISNLGNCPSVIKTRTFVVQKYIESPLLINKRKFDIRAWVLVTHELKGYFFKEGYLRMSSTEYRTDANSREIHLTNNAVQKYTDSYGQFEDGNQLSYKSFQKYLDETFPDKKVSVRDQLYHRMLEYVNMTLMCAKKKLNPDGKRFCFEIYGYDFMIDSEFNVWLIEINTNPCLEESSNILKCLIPRMLDDAFKLTIDCVFPKKKHKDEVASENANKKFSVEGYDNDENMWELVLQFGVLKQVPSSPMKNKKDAKALQCKDDNVVRKASDDLKPN